MGLSTCLSLTSNSVFCHHLCLPKTEPVLAQFFPIPCRMFSAVFAVQEDPAASLKKLMGVFHEYVHVPTCTTELLWCSVLTRPRPCRILARKTEMAH